MGKSGSGGYSLLDLLKKAFRSPSKDTQKSSSRRRDNESDYEQEEDEEEEKQQNPGKRRWMSRKPPEKANVHKKVEVERTEPCCEKQTMAVAMATAAAAEAMAATAQAAVQMIRLTRPFLLVKEQLAATCIQTAFRGYLVRDQ